MNLYFRMLIVFVKIWLRLKKQWSEESALHFRALPFDCDVNLHLRKLFSSGLFGALDESGIGGELAH